MKQEAVFFCRNEKIFDRQGQERIFRSVSLAERPFPEDKSDEHFLRLASDGCTLIRWKIPHTAIEPASQGIYDEDYLAYLRRLIKKAENYGIFSVIDPVTNRQIDTSTQHDALYANQYIEAMTHCARRIKDCKSVIGFYATDAFRAELIAALQKKHEHYIFFTDDTDSIKSI